MQFAPWMTTKPVSKRLICVVSMALFASNSILITFPSFKCVTINGPKRSKIVSFHPDTFDVLKDTLVFFHLFENVA